MDVTKPLEQRIRELEEEISILKQKQIEISEAKELYLKIFEEFPALIWRSRLDKSCDYFNKTWLEFTGRSMEQEIGNGWAEGVHPDDFDFCLKTYLEAFDARKAFLMEYRLKNKFGEYRWLRDFGQPFYDLDHSFLGYIGSCYDITEIKDNELKLSELNNAKDKFFSIIAHDLQNPFNTILGFSEQLLTMAQEKDYDQVEKYAGIILQSSGRVMNLLTNLMQWAQSQSGRMPFNPEPFDLNELIGNVELLLKDSLTQKSIAWIAHLMPDIRIRADKEMLSTVMRNLISNAIKFTRPGGTITLSTAIRSHKLIITVADNGVGMSPDRLKKLFRINESTSTPGTQNEKGTGFGLILAQEFIGKHGGKILVKSQPGSGSTFSIVLPDLRITD